jgi:hypothetical protein
LLVPVGQVGTDPELCSTAGNRPIDADWVNASQLNSALGARGGKEACGYVAPPLVGIWAAAPYFHNGSVPTLDDVINSHGRPARWAYAANGKPTERVYDPVKGGWHVDTNPHCDARYIYDTSKAGYHNTGHAYGDSLNPQQRGELIEYLKSL